MDTGVEGGRRRRIIRYKPLPSQQRFHASEARYKGFSGPIGSGKSQALCHEAIKLAYLNPGRVGLIAAPTYSMLRDATQMALLEALGDHSIPYVHNKAYGTITFEDTRSVVLLRSLDNYERLRGTNLAWFGVDELTYAKEEAWTRLEGRLREPRAKVMCGFGVWTPRGFDWVYERFVKDGGGDCEVIFARPAENEYLLSQAPGFYERLKSSYDERFYRQEVLGEYLNICQDRVYHTFDRGVHLKAVPVTQAEPLLWALDFNVDPMCSIVAQIRGGHVYVLDEIVLRRATTRAACEELLARYGTYGGTLRIYGDASGAHMQTSGMTDYQMIRKALSGAWRGPVEQRVPPSNPPVAERVALTNGKLMPATGEPGLFINARCKELIRDLEEVVYREGSGIVDKRDPMRTHLSDALGYLLWQEFGERPKVGERGRQLI